MILSWGWKRCQPEEEGGVVQIGEEQRHKPAWWLLVTVSVLAGPLRARRHAGPAVWEE